MKVFQSSLFRALVALVVGVLIIRYRTETVRWLMVTIGVLFFLSGVISFAIYLGERRQAVRQLAESGVAAEESKSAPAIPVVGIGSMVLGLILAFMPSTFVTGLTYVLLAILVLGAVTQYVLLASASHYCKVHWFYWVLPTLVLLASILVIVNFKSFITQPLLVMGWTMLLYGVTELLCAFKTHQADKVLKAREEALAREEAERARLEEERRLEEAAEQQAEAAPEVTEEQEETITAEPVEEKPEQPVEDVPEKEEPKRPSASEEYGSVDIADF